MWNYVERCLTAVLLASIVILVLLAATLRTFGVPVIWSVDVAQLLFVWLSVLAANQALRQGTHARLDILLDRLTVKMRLRLTLLLNCISILCLLVVTVFGIQLVGVNPARTLGSTAIPYAMVTAALPCGAALMIVTLIKQCFTVFKYLHQSQEGQPQPDFLQSILRSAEPSCKDSGQEINP